MSDTEGLRRPGRLARPSGLTAGHGSGDGTAAAGKNGARAGAPLLVLALALALSGLAPSACRGEKRDAAPPPATPEEQARALAAPGAPLPSRAEAVAVADQVAILSARAGLTPEGARLAVLAADLRVRMWRFDQANADAREALELLGGAAAAAPGTEQACEADRRRALLAGEHARDPAVTFRETYLASHRVADGPCATAMASTLAATAAFRPRGDAMRALEREATSLRAALAAAAPAASGAAGAASAPAPTGPAAEIVVKPSEAALPKGPVRITAIERYGAEMAARVVVHLSGPTTFEVGALGAAEPGDGGEVRGPRIYVDVARASARGVPREIAVGGIVKRVRVGARDAGSRVVLDLGATAHRRVFFLPDPFRIVIDVGTRTPGPLAPERGARREVRRVVLDPGHGGSDPGAVGPTGLREKDVTLDVAHRAAPILARELGIETLLTRDDDRHVALEDRTARANAFHADLFVSIHCNASDNGHARGVQTFVLDTTRDEVAARVAARENASGSGQPAAAPDPAVTALFASVNLANLAVRSTHLAELLQRAALASVSERYPDTPDQGVKTAAFYVLMGAEMPSVLFETSFVSNSVDEARLATADFRQKMADAIVNAVKAYREGK